MTTDAISDDARLVAGIAHQQALLSEATAAGSTVVGWKAGLGAPAARAALGLRAPLIGFLFDTTRAESRGTVDITRWSAPRAEAEIAVRLGVDVPPDASASQALDAVDAVASAIELVDLTQPPADPAQVLAGNIYHRVWLTGPFLPVDGMLTLSGRTVRVETSTAGTLTVEDLEMLTGPVGAVLVEVARMAARIGRGLRAGDIVLLGSVVPLQEVSSGGSFRVVLDGRQPVEVTFR